MYLFFTSEMHHNWRKFTYFHKLLDNLYNYLLYNYTHKKRIKLGTTYPLNWNWTKIKWFLFTRDIILYYKKYEELFILFFIEWFTDVCSKCVFYPLLKSIINFYHFLFILHTNFYLLIENVYTFPVRHVPRKKWHLKCVLSAVSRHDQLPSKCIVFHSPL